MMLRRSGQFTLAHADFCATDRRRDRYYSLRLTLWTGDDESKRNGNGTCSGQGPSSSKGQKGLVSVRADPSNEIRMLELMTGPCQPITIQP